MKHISTHLRGSKGIKAGGSVVAKSMADRRTERGELMKYFCEKLNPSRIEDGLPPITMARMGRLLEGIPTKDLYYLQTVCKDAKNFSKKFWWELKNDTSKSK